MAARPGSWCLGPCFGPGFGSGRATGRAAMDCLVADPPAALDPETRATVRNDLADILRKLNLTTIIVTHDREEAFQLADRVAVLVDGEIQQHAKPQEVYEHPANLSVARFMGVNVVPIQLLSDGQAQLNGGEQAIRCGA